MFGQQGCLYNPLSNPFFYYNVQKNISNITDSSATINANYSPTGQADGCGQVNHIVQFGFWYSDTCSDLALWNVLTVNQNFSIYQLNTADSVNILTGNTYPFSEGNTNYTFKLHDLLPNTKYYLRWFIKDSGINANPQICPFPIVQLGNNLDSFITNKVPNWLGAKTKMAQNISANSAKITGKFMCYFNPPNVFQPLREVICWGTDSVIDIASNFFNAVNIELGEKDINPNLMTFPLEKIHNFQLNNLKPSTKYYAKVAWIWTDPLDRSVNGIHVMPGNIVSFTTQPALLSNNYIKTESQTICSNSKGIYNSPIIIASQPQGASGIYSFIWQKKSSINNSWKNCVGGSILSYTTQNYSTPIDSFVVVEYRRLISSDQQTDSSYSVKFTFLSKNYNPIINIDIINIASKGINLIATTPNEINNYTAKWKNSLINGNNIKTLVNSNVFTIIQDVKNNYLNNKYWVEINVGNNCQVYNSVKLQVTPPDGDGNIYPAVEIGKQLWMMSNLRTTTFNDGTPIKSIDSQTYSWYNNDSVGNYIINGALYNASVVQNVNKNVCPTGWKPASYIDWDTLINRSGGSFIAGYKIKTPFGWGSYNRSVSNAFNFNAKPSGKYSLSYIGKGFLGSWWGIDNSLSNSALQYYFEITSIAGMVYKSNFINSSRIRNEQQSIRCIKK